MVNVTEELKDSIKGFFNLRVKPAFEEIKAILEQLGKKVVIEQADENRMTIKALLYDEEDFSYSIWKEFCKPNEHINELQAVPIAETYVVHRNISRGDRLGDIRLKKGYYTIDDVSINDIVKHYKLCFRFQLKEHAF